MEWSTKSIYCALLFLHFVFSVKTETSTIPTAAVKPAKYFIEISTTEDHFKNATGELKFEGKVTVDFEAKIPKSDSSFRIELNAQSKTEITSLKLKVFGQPNEDIKNVKYEISGNMLVITCPKEAANVRNFQLEVAFKNPFGDDMTGFYRSSFKDEKGETVWLLTTHFEPIFARKAFPCFDRPDLKAIFEIQIRVPKDIKTVLSNTAVMLAQPSGKEVIFKFKPTLIHMSTYLVAFTASNLMSSKEVKFESDYNSDVYTKERLLKTYGREAIIKGGEEKLAQSIGSTALKELTKYLGIGYAFEKVDQVGIPDFSAGAMENWGHISFREKSLFFNEKKSTANTFQANILTITHELVHQWFGNLVTLESWDYIWLNEAFANYIEYIIANKFNECKDWDLMNQLVVNEIHLRALETDGFASSKALNNIITDENLIFSSFDDIPYSKGAAVLRMWDLQLPNNGFQSSLKQYINDRKTLTANPEQLLKAFKEKTEMEADNFNSWIVQAGYPVVEVKKTNDSYTLTQERFVWDGSNAKSNASWVIPITYSTENSTKFDTTPSLWLKKDPVSLDLKGKPKWFIINNQQAGYYRVNYGKENWEALSSALMLEKFSNIHELNRAQLINDVFSLARSLQKEYIDYPTALNLIKYLRNESSFVVWKTALNSLEFLRTKVFGEKYYSKFKDYVSLLIEPHFKTLNSANLAHIEKLKTVEISRWACNLDLKSCVKEAEVMYKNNTYDESPDTRETILCTVIRNDKSTWNNVFKKYENESDSALKVMYISTLGCTSDEKTINEFLNKTLVDNSVIRKQDLTFVLSSVYNGNLNNVETAFKFIEKNYKEIAEKYGGINPLGKALVGISRKLKTKEHLKRLEALVALIRQNPKLTAAVESTENALNIVRSNVNWVEKRMKQVDKYFNSGSLLSYSFGLLLLCILSVFQF